jgi:hypothetical protein
MLLLVSSQNAKFHQCYMLNTLTFKQHRLFSRSLTQLSDQIYGIHILQCGEKNAEKMKSQLVVRKYTQELAIPSVL